VVLLYNFIFIKNFLRENRSVHVKFIGCKLKRFVSSPCLSFLSYSQYFMDHACVYVPCMSRAWISKRHKADSLCRFLHGYFKFYKTMITTGFGIHYVSCLPREWTHTHTIAMLKDRELSYPGPGTGVGLWMEYLHAGKGDEQYNPALEPSLHC
jgi:hypothetical protein